METEPPESCVLAEEQDGADSEAWCLRRVGRNTDWLHLPEDEEITVGRGLDVTYQLTSPTCLLMISRLHCVFRQKGSNHCVVTDKKSVNGVWVNGTRITAETGHVLRQGDSIQLGVATAGSKVEYDYILVRLPLKDIKPHLAQVCGLTPKAPPVAHVGKRKFATDEPEPTASTSSTADKSSTKWYPSTGHKRRPRQPSESSVGRGGVKQQDKIVISDDSNGPGDLDNLQMFSQNILMLRERVKDTQQRVASMEGTSRQGDAAQEAQVRELLAALRTKMQRMETLEKSFSQSKMHLAQKTKQEEEVLKKQLEEALQEQRNVMEELAHSRQGFEELLLAKNKELEVTKEEKEKERAKKEEVVMQVTEVMENELQCIICAELFIEAYVLNCTHIFCLHCIGEWRKRKNECPICRQTIRSQTRCLPLDNFIDGMVQTLSADTKAHRRALAAQRKGAKATAPEVTEIRDDSSSSSDNTENSSSSSSSSSSGSSSSSSSSNLGSRSGSELNSDAMGVEEVVEEEEGGGGSSSSSSIHLHSSVHLVGSTDSSVQNLDFSSSGSSDNNNNGGDRFLAW